MTTETVEAFDDEQQYSLEELGKLTDVSPRTIRYYIVEGLLPPPLTTGRNATYGQEHLDRLNAIAAMKEMYLPLREIRHRLNTLTPGQMRDPVYLATLSQAVAMERAGRKHGRHARMHADRQVSRHSRRPEARMAARSMHTEIDAEPLAEAGQSWDRIPLGDDAELLIRTHKARQMGPRLYRTLHRLRHMIDNTDAADEGNRS